LGRQGWQHMNVRL